MAEKLRVPGPPRSPLSATIVRALMYVLNAESWAVRRRACMKQDVCQVPVPVPAPVPVVLEMMRSSGRGFTSRIGSDFSRQRARQTRPHPRRAERSTWVARWAHDTTLSKGMLNVDTPNTHVGRERSDERCRMSECVSASARSDSTRGRDAGDATNKSDEEKQGARAQFCVPPHRFTRETDIFNISQ